MIRDYKFAFIGGVSHSVVSHATANAFSLGRHEVEVLLMLPSRAQALAQAQALWSVRIKTCGKTLLFEIELSSKLYLIDLFKGYKLS